MQHRWWVGWCVVFCPLFRPHSGILLYYCCTIVHTYMGSWVVGGGWVFLLCTVGLYCCTICVLLYCCLLYRVVGGWIGSWVCPRVLGLLYILRSIYISRYTSPALA